MKLIIPIILVLMVLMCCQPNRFACFNHHHHNQKEKLYSGLYHVHQLAPDRLAAAAAEAAAEATTTATEAELVSSSSHVVNSSSTMATAGSRFVAVAITDLPGQVLDSARNLISVGRNRPRMLQRFVEDNTQPLLQQTSSTNQRVPICIWNCPPKQNTTNLLLFAQSGTGEEADARITKFSSPNELKNSGFLANKPTVLIVHGFRGSGLTRQTWAIDLKDLILDHERSNVLFADWSHHARVISYIHALEHIAEVTEDLYNIFDNLQTVFPRFKMTDIHVIGHSLGAHIGGLLGQMMNRQLNQITALDPAGFLLTSSEPNLKLTQDDAKYISAWHTNAKYLGTDMNLADRDIFFNGGNDQPACTGITSSIIPGACSHRQAVKYASVFMNKCILVAYLCKDYETFLAGECGFCSAHSSGCVGVGNEWQYARYSGQLKPQKFDKRKPIGDLPWIEGRAAHRYHLKMGPERPYCMFTYQVVVKFNDESQDLDGIKALDIVLRDSQNRTLTQGVWVLLSNRLRPDARLEVFTGEGKERRSISGRYLYTGLATVDFKHELYDEMPIKFTEASVARAPIATTMDGLSNSRDPQRRKQQQRQQLQFPEVYVNFMSHPKFELRAANSGLVEAVNFVNFEQANKGQREPRIESRADRGGRGSLVASKRKALVHQIRARVSNQILQRRRQQL